MDFIMILRENLLHLIQPLHRRLIVLLYEKRYSRALSQNGDETYLAGKYAEKEIHAGDYSSTRWSDWEAVFD